MSGFCRDCGRCPTARCAARPVDPSRVSYRNKLRLCRLPTPMARPSHVPRRHARGGGGRLARADARHSLRLPMRQARPCPHAVIIPLIGTNTCGWVASCTRRSFYGSWWQRAGSMTSRGQIVSAIGHARLERYRHDGSDRAFDQQISGRDRLGS